MRVTTDAMRTEYMRSLSDAYAGGPTVREHAWNRLLALIEDYAEQRTEIATSSPTMPPETATAPAVAPDATHTPKPRAKPTARKATP